MATSTLASLVISLEANISKFSTDMTTAANVTQKTMQSIEAGAALAQKALGALGGVLSAGAVLHWAEGVTGAAAELQKLSIITGSSVESLSRLANIARVSGTDFNVFQTMLTRMTASMAGVDELSSKGAKALAFLGISARDPATALQEVADKLSQYADGASKAALARDLFGRGGAQFLQSLKDMADATAVGATVTAQQAEEAHKLEEQIRRLGVEATTFKNILLSDVIPAINEWISGTKAARAAGLGWFDSLIVGTTTSEGIVPSLERAQAKVEKINLDIADAKKYNQGWLLPGYKEELADATKLLSAFISKRNALIMSNVAGMGDLGDQVSRSMAKKPDLGYSGAPDKVAVAAVDAYGNALASLVKQAAVAQDKLEALWSGTQENQGMKKMLEMMNDPSWKKFTAAQQLLLQIEGSVAIGIEDEAEATKKLLEQTKLEIEADEKAAEAKQKIVDAHVAIVNSYEATSEKMSAEIELIGKDDLSRQKLIATIENEIAAKKLETEGDKLAADALRGQLAARLQIIEKGFAASNYQKLYDEISNGITDSIMRGFENGGNLIQSFIDEIKRMFAQLVLRPIIQGIVAPLAGGITSMLSGGANAATGGGGSLGNLLGLGSGGLSSIGDAIFGPGGGAAFGAGFAAPISTATELLAGGAAEFASSGAALATTIGAAVPIVGGLVLAGTLLKGWLDSKKGGPMTRDFGTSGADISTFGDLSSTHKLIGTDAAASSQLAAYAATAQAAYQATLKALGGIGQGQFAFYTSQDPKGSASNQLDVRSTVGGKAAYTANIQDQIAHGDTAALSARLELESKRAVLGALQSSDLAGGIAKILNSVTASMASSEDIDRVLALATAFQGLSTMIDSIDVTKIDASLDKLLNTAAVDVFRTQGEALDKLLENFDGSTAATNNLAAASGQYYNSLIALLAQIREVTKNIDSMFANTREQIYLTGRDNEFVYKYLQDQADAKTAKIGTETDPAKIMQDATDVNAMITRAFGLLSPDQQNLHRDEALQGIDLVNQAADARLKELGDNATSAFKSDMSDVKELLSGITARMGAAADTQVAAANTQLAAAQTPIVVDVRVEPVPVGENNG